MSIRSQSWSPWRASLLALVVCASVTQTLSGCGQDVQVGFDSALSEGGAGLGGVGGASPLGGVGGDLPVGGVPSCVTTLCQGQRFACGDCADNDGDGLVDALDPECLGPCDGDELGLSSGLDGNQAAICRQDCYFDGDSGPGNDGCTWSHACDVHSVA
ncbi:MAG TPA: hypothetical protein VIW29_23010, partial [Polyangiaceae bacterium]